MSDRRVPIVIYGVTYTEDAISGQIPSKTVVARCYAEVVEGSGGRLEEVRQVNTPQPIVFQVRALTYPVTTKNLIVYKGIELTISSVETDILRNYTTLTAWA